MTEKWIKDIKPEDMPTENLRLIAESCGVEATIKLIEGIGGISVYIPSSAKTQIKTNYILKKYDGTRDCVNRLAIELGVSANYIYKIVNKKPEKEGKKQLSLLD